MRYIPQPDYVQYCNDIDAIIGLILLTMAWLAYTKLF
jgi:hypothetical protein